MELGSSRILALLVPTLCLLSSLCWKHLPRQNYFHRAFGGKDYYLDLRFNSNPEGLLGKSSPQVLRFEGLWVDRVAQTPVHGKLIRTVQGEWYQFEGNGGAFTGKIRTSNKQCEPYLDFELKKANSTPLRGTLLGAFCQRSS